MRQTKLKLIANLKAFEWSWILNHFEYSFKPVWTKCTVYVLSDLSHPKGELEWLVPVQGAVELLAAGQLARVVHRQLITRLGETAALGWARDHLIHWLIVFPFNSNFKQNIFAWETMNQVKSQKTYTRSKVLSYNATECIFGRHSCMHLACVTDWLLNSYLLSTTIFNGSIIRGGSLSLNENNDQFIENRVG